MTTLKQCAVTIGIAGAMAIGAMSSAYAAPLMSGAGVIKATPTQATDVAWRGGRGGGFARGGFRGGFAHGGFRGGRGAGVVAGVAAGALVGAAIANSGYGYGPNYYAPDGYAPYPYDAGPPVAYEPGYAPYGYGSPCVTDDGYGRMRPCDSE